ncbi:MAG: glycoside hydrolase family 15 protein [Acidimicrobiia bacterium]
MTDDYPPIADHGLIGDQQTCALVDTQGTIDWFCCPRFDAPSVFGSLLDRDKGGQFRLAPAANDVVTKQLYFPDTAILITRFLSSNGVGEISDFMPVDRPSIATDRHAIVRMLRVPRGTMTFSFEVAPRFDYGRAPHKLQTTEHGAVFESDHGALTLHSPVALEQRGDDVGGSITLNAGDVAGFILESGPSVTPRPPNADALDAEFRETARFWRQWLAGSTYHGRWRDMVYRAAITLKLLTFAPTGAPVAAATTGLPEQVGGERNWDYRYTWIRDGSLTVQALDRLGFTDDALMFLLWLRERFENRAPDASGPLRIMYRVDGSSDLEESTLDHWEGYRGSAPVRIGNGATDQLQLDIYGEAFDAVYHAERKLQVIGKRGWNDLRAIVDWVCENWDQPEEGLWEVRGGRQAFVYGRMMCWVALDRAIRIATLGSHPAPLERWTETRDAIDAQIVAQGWDEGQKALVQHYGSDVLDAAILAAPRLHYLAPTDEIWLGTLAGIEQQLVSDSLVYRYNPEASPDGLRGSEGTFSMCTFWYVDALTRTGRLEDARLVFEKMLTYANHLGLFAEEIGQTGEQLGNFPQAFTHLSLITAAVDLDRALDEQRH